jgi:AcrR family transcriptional regulator
MAEQDHWHEPSSRAPRADAARNRAAIIGAAGEVLAELGSGADVREIARRSGVGMGTLYRHFPSKEDLLDAVLHTEYVAWAHCARDHAAQQEDPMAALADFVQRAVWRQLKHRALRERYADSWSGPATECTVLLTPILDGILARGHRAGVFRQAVTPDDLLLLISSTAQSAWCSGAARPGLWQRLVQIYLDGLSAEHSTGLPPAGEVPQYSSPHTRSAKA